MYGCLECNNRISHAEYKYSTYHFGIPLCRIHQEWLKSMENQTTPENLMLYFSLKERGVKAQIEKFDGFKHIDIAIPEAKVNIEVDGTHHNTNYKQALTDLKRSYASFKKGYFTLRIPNSLVRNRLYETVEYILGFLEINFERVNNQWSNNYKERKNNWP